MNIKIEHRWIMYYEIQKQQWNGKTPSQIAEYLVMDTRTVKKYLAMRKKEYETSLESQSRRTKKLASYEDFVKGRLELCHEASSAQVHDWLKEHYSLFPKASIRTVYDFVLFVRQKHNLVKVFTSRQYQQVEELPYGEQAQVDFGEYNMSDVEGHRKKVYFLALVLSRSRFKMVFFSDHPFTASSAIESHEVVFSFIEGYPRELVYDQDKVLLANENKGDVVLTEAFRAYCQSRPFKVRFCRKSDPQSKGKIENVIKYIKYNFLRGRLYYGVFVLNDHALDWLSRTANVIEHSTTHKIPALEWMIEKAHLIPLQPALFNTSPRRIYAVSKDNVIHYKGSTYSVPIGTYHGAKTEVQLEQRGDILIITDTSGKEIIQHPVSYIKGKQVRHKTHYRDHSLSVSKLIDQVASRFTDQQKAHSYLDKVHLQFPRYTRDQMQIIEQTAKKYTKQDMDLALVYCLVNHLEKATDFEPVLLALREQQQIGEGPIANNEPCLQNPKYKIQPHTSSIS
ncbi:MAG: IS21 family transposase, partial [Bacteroidales bacterium]|nr:IS21 family transposase [Bacteroidales bacterium]